MHKERKYFKIILLTITMTLITSNLTALGGQNNPPIAYDDYDQVFQNSENNIIDVMSNDYSPKWDISIVSVSKPKNGQTSFNDDYVFYTPRNNFIGNDDFVYTIEDEKGRKSSASVYITVVEIINNTPPVAVDDSFSILEDSIDNQLDVLANDYDVDGDNLTIVSVTPPYYGVVTFTDNFIYYAPAPNYNGLEQFSYTITDGKGGFATAMVLITVFPVNDPPIAGDDSITIQEDQLGYQINVLANDYDPDDDSLTITGVTNPVHGYSATDGDYVWYGPVPDYCGLDQFNYTIDDGNGCNASATVYITIVCVNDPPIANDDYVNVSENSTNNQIDILANDLDVDGDSLTITSVTIPLHGSLTINGSNIYYTPDIGYTGPDQFNYTIYDDYGESDSATVFIFVIQLNNNTPPVAVDDYFAIMENSINNILNVLANDYDVDGDQLTIISITQPFHGIVTFDGYFIYYTPNMDYYGSDEFTYTISDGNGGTDSATVYIDVIPDVHIPVANDDYFTVLEDSVNNLFDVLINDCDPYGEDLDIISVTTPLHGSVLYTSDFIYYTPDQNYNGVDIFSYTIINEGGFTDSAEVYITVTPVNDPPVANYDSHTVVEGSTNNMIYVLANDYDIDGDQLTIISTTQPSHGMVTFTSNYILYTPDANYCGLDQFSYTISDGNGGSDSAMVYITVGCDNTEPVAVDDYAVVAENSTNNMIDVLANDFDIDGDPLTIISIHTDPLHGSASTDGSFAYYTPDVGFVGSDQFDYIIIDGFGGSDIATVYITVGEPNMPPVANNDVITVSEDSVDNMIDVLANDFDPDNDTIFITSVTDPPHGTVATDGLFVFYSPDSNYFGVDQFTYTISDGNGGTDSATVLVNIDGVNDAPNAVDDAETVYRNSTNNQINVLANDFDIDGDNLIIISVTDPSHGTSAFDGDFVYYTPDSDFTGMDQFDYTIADGNGGSDSATVLISVVEPGNNTPPVAVSDFVTVPEDSFNNQINVLANDYDIDGDALSIVGVTNPIHGIATFTVDFVYYTPDPDYFGSDSFYYTITDDHGGTDSAAVYITVSPSNDPPIANDDADIVIKNTVNNQINVLINDFDPDGDTLTIISVSIPMHGVAITDGDFVYYTPDPDFIGMDQFDYTIIDGNGGTDVATVTITVEDQPLNPIANDDFYTINEDSVHNLWDVLTNDVDPDGDPLTIVSLTNPTHGIALTDGTYIYYTPNPNYFGSDQMMYTISDGQGGTDVGTVYITITGINDPPTANSDTATVPKDSNNNQLNVLANDFDVDGDSLSIVSVSAPSHGIVSFTVDFVYYTPDPGYTGADQFTYTISDGNGGTDVATVYITIV